MEQTNVAEHDYMLQFLKKLKLCAELVSETLLWVLTSKFSYDYLFIIIIYKSIFTTRASPWATCIKQTAKISANIFYNSKFSLNF